MPTGPDDVHSPGQSRRPAARPRLPFLDPSRISHQARDQLTQAIIPQDRQADQENPKRKHKYTPIKIVATNQQGYSKAGSLIQIKEPQSPVTTLFARRSFGGEAIMGFVIAGALAALVAIMLAVTGSSTARRLASQRYFWRAGSCRANSLIGLDEQIHVAYSARFGHALAGLRGCRCWGSTDLNQPRPKVAF